MKTASTLELAAKYNTWLKQLKHNYGVHSIICTCLITSFHQDGRFLTHETSLTPPLFIEVPRASQDSERS